MIDLRVLIASENIGLVGGAEKYIQSILPMLTERGHTLAIVHADSPENQAETLDPTGVYQRWTLATNDLQTILEAIQEWAPDVVYCQGLRCHLLESALVSRYPSVLFAHNYYGTCGTGTKTHFFPIIRPCSRKFGPVCLLLHYPLRCGGLSPSTTLFQYKLQSRRKSFLTRYKAVLVASEHMLHEFSQNGVPAPRLHHVPLPLTDFSPVKELTGGRTPTGKILYTGRLTKMKGLQYLLSAMPAAQRALGFKLHLTVAGSGPEEKYFRTLVAKTQIDVDFVGWVDRRRRSELLQSTDILAIPSVWPEPFGLVGLEAACFGVPSVAYRVGGIPGWLEQGKTGEMAPGDPPTVEGLARAITRALQDQEHYDSLRYGAWHRSKRIDILRHICCLESVLASAVISKPFAETRS